MIEPAPGPAYSLRTPRLVLRHCSPEHAADMKLAQDASKAELLPWMPWAASLPEPVEKTIETLRGFRVQFDRSESFIYFIWRREENGSEQFVGGCGLHKRVGLGGLEVGYWIHSGFTGQGIATESAAALTRCAFEVERVHRVHIHVAVGNAASDAIPCKLGFLREATLRERITLPNGTHADMNVWSMFEADYPLSAAAKMPIEAHDVIGRRIV